MIILIHNRYFRKTLQFDRVLLQSSVMSFLPCPKLSVVASAIAARRTLETNLLRPIMQRQGIARNRLSLLQIFYGAIFSHLITSNRSFAGLGQYVCKNIIT